MAKVNLVKASNDSNQIEAIAENTTTPVDTSFAIDDDIALPETTRTRAEKYPWSKLEVNQSFFVPGAKVETFYTLCSSASKKHGGKFIARRWDGANGVAGVRVWRQK